VPRGLRGVLVLIDHEFSELSPETGPRLINRFPNPPERLIQVNLLGKPPPALAHEFAVLGMVGSHGHGIVAQVKRGQR
jgi:hypothetical protein